MNYQRGIESISSSVTGRAGRTLSIAVDSRGNRYYDHNLTHIEKGKLLDHISGKAVIDGFGTTPGTKPTTERKVSKLISILQTKGQKNAQKERVLNHINKLAEKQLWPEHRVDQ